MSSRLDAENRGILEGRPSIQFVEPKVIAVPPQPVPELAQVKSVREEVRQTKAVANAVEVLAGALQARVNLKAKNMAIDLDPKVDSVVIAAMRRMYPDDDDTIITYEQYIKCKERLRERGYELADQALKLNDAKAISDARIATGTAVNSSSGIGGSGATGDAATQSAGVTSAMKAAGITTPLGAPNPFYEDFEGAKKTALYGSKKAKRGGLRPELDEYNTVVEAIDLDEFQDCMIKILVNFLWKKFIRPILFVVLNGMIPFSGFALPKKIAKCPPGFKVKEMVARGVPILGEKKPKKQKAPKPDAKKVTG